MLMVYKRTKHPWEDRAVLIGEAKRMREREREICICSKC